MGMEISERVGHAAKNTVTGKTYSVTPAAEKKTAKKKTSKKSK